jgi:uracil-DNA glycosylase
VRVHVKKKPPSLRNIHQVLESDLSDLGVRAPAHGNLEAWAEQGVLLLNTALTVRAGTKDDREVHRRWRCESTGWTTFTDAVIKAVNDKTDSVVFILWGNDAKKKDEEQRLIDRTRHAVIKSSHPSPFSARLGFLTSRPFSEENNELKSAGRTEIDWGRICHHFETPPAHSATTGPGDDVECEPGTPVPDRTNP